MLNRIVITATDFANPKLEFTKGALNMAHQRLAFCSEPDRAALALKQHGT